MKNEGRIMNEKQYNTSRIVNKPISDGMDPERVFPERILSKKKRITN